MEAAKTEDFLAPKKQRSEAEAADTTKIHRITLVMGIISGVKSSIILFVLSSSLFLKRSSRLNEEFEED